MKFHFEFDIKKLQDPVSHHTPLLLIGSCFTENIGEKLRRYKFPVLENPNGILFNPVSVCEALVQYIENKHFTSEHLFQWQETWHSWKHHSRFSGISPEDALSKINRHIENAHGFLKGASHILITLGSAWTYVLTKEAIGVEGAVAANNHKAPASWFRRKLMTVEEVLQVLDNTLHRLFLFNPELKIIFTISPVRHLREGVVENNRSKAVLVQAVHHMVDKFEKLYYFPAYELVIDDLRDYRFYAEDLVHPNYAATEYVWEKFTGACMEAETRDLIGWLHDLYLAYKHRPFYSGTEAHRKFLAAYLDKARHLQERYPSMDLGAEIRYFTSGIHLDQ